jgi:hypothetical protein
MRSQLPGSQREATVRFDDFGQIRVMLAKLFLMAESIVQ